MPTSIFFEIVACLSLSLSLSPPPSFSLFFFFFFSFSFPSFPLSFLLPPRRQVTIESRPNIEQLPLFSGRTRVGFIWNARAYLAESSLQSISSNLFFSKRTNCLAVIQTWLYSSMLAAGSKRRELAFYFSIRICCMFHLSKCRGESGLGSCKTSGLVKRMPLRSGEF